MEEILNVAFCPHCKIVSRQKLIQTHENFVTRWFGDDLVEDLTVYYIAACETCNGVLVYHDFAYTEEKLIDTSRFTRASLEYPNSGKLDSLIVPTQVADIYNNNIWATHLDPTELAVQIRRALEVVCDDREAEGESLQDRLSDLALKGEIPKKLVNNTYVFWLLDNMDAYASNESVNNLQAQTIRYFFHAIIEYVYVAPRKVKSFKERLEGCEEHRI